MKRWIVGLALCLLFLLGLTTAVLWTLADRWIHAGCWLYVGERNDIGVSVYPFAAQLGVTLTRETPRPDPLTADLAEAAWKGRARQRLMYSSFPGRPRLPVTSVWQNFQFSARSSLSQFGIHRDKLTLSMPSWAWLLLLWLWPAIWLVRRLRKWRRHRQGLRHGLCEHCGYDLRATPDRCPECGTVAPSRATFGQVAVRNGKP